jgi:hypothetical protein
LRIEANGVLRFTTPNPTLSLTLGSEVVNTPYCEITFAIEGARAEAEGELRLHALGAEHVIMDLKPCGRAIYSAIVCAPLSGATLLWRLDRVVDVVRLAGLAARPLSRAELLVLAKGQDSEVARALDDVREPSTCSRKLTTLVCGPQIHSPISYEHWIQQHELAPDDARQHWGIVVQALRRPPLISLLTPVYNTPEFLLREMLDSVLEQIYPKWELCIADDASSEPHVGTVLMEYARRDPRIRVLRRPVNGHISAASNSALEIASGDWVALLDHDDRLPAHALAVVAQEVERHPEAVLIYSDEDKIDVAGRRFDPYFKPDLSPHLLRSQNMVNHLAVYRTESVVAVGGFRLGYEGSQDHDLALRVVEGVHPHQVRHIPQVLYHWRSLPGSTAADAAEKPYAADASRRAVRDHLTRTGVSGTVTVSPVPGWMCVRPTLPQPPPRVSLILTAHAKLSEQLRNLTDTTLYSNYEVLVVADPSEAAPVCAALQNDRVHLVLMSGVSSLRSVLEAASGSIIGLIGSETRPSASDWLTLLTAWAVQPQIGCVGPKLLFVDGRVASAGIVIGGAAAGHPHQGALRSDNGYFGRLVLPHNVSAVDPACLFAPRDFLCEASASSSEASFCLDIFSSAQSLGYWNVIVPYVELNVGNPPTIIDARRESREQFDPFCARQLTLNGSSLALCSDIDDMVP